MHLPSVNVLVETLSQQSTDITFQLCPEACEQAHLIQQDYARV